MARDAALSLGVGKLYSRSLPRRTSPLPLLRPSFIPEIFSFAQQPWGSNHEEDAINFIKKGVLLDKPSECPGPVYQMMEGCWEVEADERPLAAAMCSLLASIDASNYVGEYASSGVAKEGADDDDEDDDYETAENPKGSAEQLAIDDDIGVIENLPQNPGYATSTAIQEAMGAVQAAMAAETSEATAAMAAETSEVTAAAGPVTETEDQGEVPGNSDYVNEDVAKNAAKGIFPEDDSHNYINDRVVREQVGATEVVLTNPGDKSPVPAPTSAGSDEDLTSGYVEDPAGQPNHTFEKGATPGSAQAEMNREEEEDEDLTSGYVPDPSLDEPSGHTIPDYDQATDTLEQTPAPPQPGTASPTPTPCPPIDGRQQRQAYYDGGFVAESDPMPPATLPPNATQAPAQSDDYVNEEAAQAPVEYGPGEYMNDRVVVEQLRALEEKRRNAPQLLPRVSRAPDAQGQAPVASQAPPPQSAAPSPGLAGAPGGPRGVLAGSQGAVRGPPIMHPALGAHPPRPRPGVRFIAPQAASMAGTLQPGNLKTEEKGEVGG